MAGIFREYDYEVLAPDRESSGNMNREIQNLWDLADDSIVVGVSGGATLAWELAACGCPMKEVFAHEPAAGSLVPGLLAGPGSAFTNMTGSEPEKTIRDKAAFFGRTLYGPNWRTFYLPDDTRKVFRDYQMFAAFEPHKPQIPVNRIHLTIGGASPQNRYDVAEQYAYAFRTQSYTILDARHFLPVDCPKQYAEYILQKIGC